MRSTKLALVTVVSLLFACTRRDSPPTLTVVALEKAQPDAGVWAGKELASKTTTDAGQIAIVTNAFTAAEKTTRIRCTFHEGGEPSSLRFDLSDHRKVYLFGVQAVAERQGACWRLDETATTQLRVLANELGVSAPL